LTQNGSPPGFILQPDFLDPQEERQIIDFLGTVSFGEVRMHGVIARRRVAQFGLRYSFETYKLTPAAGIPAELAGVRTRAAVLAGIAAEEFAEALVTEYPPGAGIGWHRDAPQFGIVAGVSLGAECRMRFQKGEGNDRVTAATVLPSRSIYLLSGEARSKWQHSIPPVKVRRWSITFRTLRGKKGPPDAGGPFERGV
jgi:alkylated DNA repair dioxygenase AlkB